MKTRINVAIRIRPLLEHEELQGEKATTINIDEKNNVLKIQGERGRSEKEYAFDRVLGPTISQEGVFRECNIPMLLDRVVEGYHATIFAYGQTGAGKTYTMEGYSYSAPRDHSVPKPIFEASDKLGIIPRCIDYLFGRVSHETERSPRKFTIYCSFLQIYNERIFDLLNPAHFAEGVSAPGLKLRFKNENFHVDNLYIFEVRTVQDVIDLFHFGLSNRVVATHRLNHASSRSHSLLTLTVESVDINNPDDLLSSKLQLVDLAGSERVYGSEYDSKLTKECIEINKSLFTLRKVISTLAEIQASGKSVYVPYRDSKLTSLLRQSLGGNSYALMISSLRPGDTALEENISTLNYSTKAAFISNKPIKNQDPKVRLISDLKRENRELTAELQKAQEHIDLLTKLTEAKKEEIFQPLKTGSNISLPPREISYKEDYKPSLFFK